MAKVYEIQKLISLLQTFKGEHGLCFNCGTITTPQRDEVDNIFKSEHEKKVVNVDICLCEEIYEPEKEAEYMKNLK